MLYKYCENTGMEYKLYEILTLGLTGTADSNTQGEGPHQLPVRSDSGGASAPPMTAVRLT